MFRAAETARSKPQPKTGLQAYAAELLEIGKPHDQIADKLVDHGLTPEEATDMVVGLVAEQLPPPSVDASAPARSGSKHMVFGTLFLAIGLGIVVGAAELNADRLILLAAYGALFVGVTQLAYGLLRQVNG